MTRESKAPHPTSSQSASPLVGEVGVDHVNRCVMEKLLPLAPEWGVLSGWRGSPGWGSKKQRRGGGAQGQQEGVYNSPRPRQDPHLCRGR